MLNHFYALMVLVWVAGFIVDLFGILLPSVRARILIDALVTCALGALLGYTAFTDLGPLNGLIGGAFVFIALYAIITSLMVNFGPEKSTVAELIKCKFPRL